MGYQTSHVLCLSFGCGLCAKRSLKALALLSCSMKLCWRTGLPYRTNWFMASPLRRSMTNWVASLSIIQSPFSFDGSLYRVQIRLCSPYDRSSSAGLSVAWRDALNPRKVLVVPAWELVRTWNLAMRSFLHCPGHLSKCSWFLQGPRCVLINTIAAAPFISGSPPGAALHHHCAR